MSEYPKIQTPDAASSSDGRKRNTVLSDGTVELTAAVFKVLGDPTRIRVLEVLNEQGSATGSGLMVRLGMTQQAVSKQLGILHRAGIVRKRRKGAWVHYELIDWTGWWLVEQTAATLAVSGDARRD
jgi:DNA-binding transcriptional ArsR family regulator